MTITDEQAVDARLVLMTWFAKRGAALSTHFATPSGEAHCFPDPLAMVLARGEPMARSLEAWVAEAKRGMRVVGAAPPVSTMRPLDQIQRAHDILWGVVNDDRLAERVEANPWRRALLKASLSALCYALRHPHSEDFEAAIEQLLEKAEAAGFRLREGPPPPAAAPSPRDPASGRIANEDLT